MLSDMVKGQLEKLIIKRSDRKTSIQDGITLDEQITTLYKLLSKLIVMNEGDLRDQQTTTLNHMRMEGQTIADNKVEFIFSLRVYWSSLCYAIHSATQYTYNENPTEARFDEICILLRQAIDNLRTYFLNVGKSSPQGYGLYPFEPLKEILNSFVELGYKQNDNDVRAKARTKIVESWKEMQAPFLLEFMREEPKKPVSRFLKLHSGEE
jgi:hypothetical protein